MKEKRYEITKRKDREEEKPMNALASPEEKVNGDILENVTKYHSPAARSSLRNAQERAYLNSQKGKK